MKKNSILMAILCLAFLMSCGPAEKKEAEDAGDTPPPPPEAAASELIGEEITYSSDSVDMKGYIAYKKGEEKVPGILVVHEWWGHNDYARQRADMLAELGYVALAVDMYGGGQVADHPDGAGKFAQMVMGNIDGAKARFEAALETLKANPQVDNSKIAAIGYCFGGSVALSMANLGLDLDAVAAFHSGVQLPAQPQEGGVKAKILVCNGAADPFIPAETVEAYKQAMDAAGADYEYISYDSAKHSFTSQVADSVGAKLGLPLAYDQAADEDSWAKMQALFDSVFK